MATALRNFLIPHQFDYSQRQRATNMRAIERQFNGLGTWQNFIPTLSGGWAMGNSTYTARYTLIGLLCIFYCNIVLGSTATMGTTLTCSLPFQAYTTNSEQIGNFHAMAYDASVPSMFPLIVVAHTATTVTFDCINTASTYAVSEGVTATAPFAWATPDELFYGGIYEVV